MKHRAQWRHRQAGRQQDGGLGAQGHGCRAAASQEGQGTDQEGHRKREPFSSDRKAPRMPRGSKHRVRGLARAEGGGRGRRVYTAWTGGSGGTGGQREKRGSRQHRRHGSPEGAAASRPPALGEPGPTGRGRRAHLGESLRLQGTVCSLRGGTGFSLHCGDSGASLSKDHAARSTPALYARSRLLGPHGPPCQRQHTAERLLAQRLTRVSDAG